MKKSGPIAILAHWRTGSTLLKNVLEACGMKDCRKEFGVENGDIDNVGVNLYRMNQFPLAKTTVRRVLAFYREEAKKANWKNYGIKINHALQARCWESVGMSFKDEWPDARYVISIRHPIDIVGSINRLRKEVDLNPDFTDEEIAVSWTSAFMASCDLIEKNEALVILYPDSYRSGGIESLVKRLGLRWTKKASELFDSIEVFESTPKEYKKYESMWPEAVHAFEEVIEHADI